MRAAHSAATGMTPLVAPKYVSVVTAALNTSSRTLVNATDANAMNGE